MFACSFLSGMGGINMRQPQNPNALAAGGGLFANEAPASQKSDVSTEKKRESVQETPNDQLIIRQSNN